MAPDMFSGWGIRTLSSGIAGLQPDELPQRLGLAARQRASSPPGSSATATPTRPRGSPTALFDVAARRARLPPARAVLRIQPRRGRDRSSRYPVACIPQAWAAAAPFMLLQALLGVSPMAAQGTLTMHQPELPPWLEQIELRGLRVGHSDVDLAFARNAAGVTAFSLLSQRGEIAVTMGSDPALMTPPRRRDSPPRSAVRTSARRTASSDIASRTAHPRRRRGRADRLAVPRRRCWRWRASIASSGCRWRRSACRSIPAARGRCRSTCHSSTGACASMRSGFRPSSRSTFAASTGPPHSASPRTSASTSSASAARPGGRSRPILRGAARRGAPGGRRRRSDRRGRRPQRRQPAAAAAAGVRADDSRRRHRPRRADAAAPRRARQPPVLRARLRHPAGARGNRIRQPDPAKPQPGARYAARRSRPARRRAGNAQPGLPGAPVRGRVRRAQQRRRTTDARARRGGDSAASCRRSHRPWLRRSRRR